MSANLYPVMALTATYNRALFERMELPTLRKEHICIKAEFNNYPIQSNFPLTISTITIHVQSSLL